MSGQYWTRVESTTRKGLLCALTGADPDSAVLEAMIDAYVLAPEASDDDLMHADALRAEVREWMRSR